MRYIAFLRGINVSGQKMIKMADLENAFESLGFSDIRTYLRSECFTSLLKPLRG